MRIGKLSLTIMLIAFSAHLFIFVNAIFLNQSNIRFGLDITGGSYIKLRVDYNKYIHDRLEDAKAHIINTNNAKAKIVNNAIIVSNTNKNLIEKFLISHPEMRYETSKSDREFIIRFANIVSLKRDILSQSKSGIQNRIDTLGVRETSIKSMDNDKIVVELPQQYDQSELLDLISKSAKLNFYVLANIDSKNTRIVVLNGADRIIEAGYILMGNLLNTANVSANIDHSAAIRLTFNSTGTKTLKDITHKFLGRTIIIAMDHKILTSATIRSQINNGEAQITGKFSTRYAKQLSSLLRSGALPAPVHVVENRVIGPNLGHKTIRAGKKAAIVTGILIPLLMIMTYKKLGALSSILLAINMMCVFAEMIVFNIVITMPGIVGLLLTTGMSVDSHVIIFEAIRERLKEEDSKVFHAIKQGCMDARATIYDSNITTLIATIIMLCIGDPIIKSFAVTLSIGVTCSVLISVFCIQPIALALFHKSNIDL